LDDVGLKGKWEEQQGICQEKRCRESKESIKR